jgi:hypothetical protein
MADELLPTAIPAATPPHKYWPWGQIGWFLAGIGFSLTGIGQAAFMFQYIDLVGQEAVNAYGGLLVIMALGCSVLAVLIRRRAKRRAEQLTHLSWLRRVNFGLLAISVSMLSLIIPAMHAARVARTQAMAAGPWIEHAFVNGSFQISTPANWELFPDPAITNSGLRLIDRQNELYLIISVISKQDLALSSLAELSQRAAQTQAQNAKDRKIGEIQTAQVDGRPATDMSVIETFDGVYVHCYFRHVEYPDTWVELRQWTTRSQFEANEPTFVKIAESIRRKQ